MTNKKLFAALGPIAKDLRGGDLTVCSPIDGVSIAGLRVDTARPEKEGRLRPAGLPCLAHGADAAPWQIDPVPGRRAASQQKGPGPPGCLLEGKYSGRGH